MTTSKKLLFIGDSITAAGLAGDSEQIGTGYVRIIHDYLKVSAPEKQLTIINKGISGNRVTDLANRWETDVIAHDPDFVSISIGINDVWRQLDRVELDQVYPDKFEQIYETLLQLVKNKTNALIILMEPTVIEEDSNSTGNKKLKSYVEVIHKLAEKYQATIVPTHEAFIDYLGKGNNYHLTTDGVHMNSAGNTLMAKTWLESAGSLLK